MAATMMRLLWLIVCVGLHSGAVAHDHGPGSWINQQMLRDPQTGEFCCNLNDCQEEAGIEAIDGGFLVTATGEVIPSARVIWKSPGGWWRCRYLSGDLAGRTRCLIGPPLGT